jgi:hypothetical protein
MMWDSLGAPGMNPDRRGGIPVRSARRLARRFAALATLPLAAALTLTASPSSGSTDASAAPPAGVSRAAALVQLRAGARHALPTVVGPVSARSSEVTAAAVSVQVTYSGFTPAARAAFQRAVNIWAPLLNSPVPITVDAHFTPLGPGILGSAGPNFIWRDFPGAPRPATWYVDAIANKRAGSQLDPAADIVANFSSNFADWHFGSAPAPAGKIDFTAVVLHELGHGLGFTGAGNVTNNRGTVRQAGSPTAYDRFTENGAGARMLGMPDNSLQLANQLRSNNLFFDSVRVRNANAGAAAKIYAPTRWQPGSSYSHLDEATYTPGSANSLMTPIINFGETIRSPGPITRALFLTIGW